MADEMVAGAEASEPAAEQATELDADKSELALSCVAAMVESGVTNFTMDASGDNVKCTVDGVALEITAEQLASVMDAAEGSEATAEAPEA
jgi:hypothetical protein